MISEKYIQSLLTENPNINIIDFAKQYNMLTKNIDISFIDQFLLLINEDEFSIHHDMLYLYGVLTEHNTRCKTFAGTKSVRGGCGLYN